MQNVKRADIYRLKDNGTPYSKPRPIVIVSVDALNRGNSVTAIPFYSQQIEDRRNRPYCVFYHRGQGGLEKDCIAKADEISLIEKLEIDFAKGPVGRFNHSEMALLEDAIRYVLGFPEAP